jgi:serine/threonine protein kinase
MEPQRDAAFFARAAFVGCDRRMINPVQKGERLGHYRVDELVTRGGMASIFRGTDLESGSPVAIKIPHPEMESHVTFFSRFQREAEIGRKLDHPSLVKVLPDVDSSRVCIIMEWAEGTLLRDILDREGKLPQDRAVRIAVRICEVLDYIHKQGVIHRDLKPDNIMIGAEDQVTLLDFGIASQAGARRLTFGKFTRSMGTPDYVAPEQVKGKRGDARSDVYALGVMLFEMLTGEVPFKGENPFVAMNLRLLENAPPARELVPEIPRSLQGIIQCALARDPDERYAGALEFGWSLEHPDQVRAAEDSAPVLPKLQRDSRVKAFLSYAIPAIIPVIIFVLLLLAAKR